MLAQFATIHISDINICLDLRHPNGNASAILRPIEIRNFSVSTTPTVPYFASSFLTVYIRLDEKVRYLNYRNDLLNIALFAGVARTGTFLAFFPMAV
jgi:hypothetical protein